MGQKTVLGGRNGVAFSCYVSLEHAGGFALQANPTLAAGDVKVVRYTSSAWSIANITTLPTVIHVCNAQYILKVDLTATEMTADDDAHSVFVQFIDAAVVEWDPFMLEIPLGMVDWRLGTPEDLKSGATLSLNAKDIYANTVYALTNTSDTLSRVGVPVALDGGTATLAGMLTKLADDNGGANFDATTDSLERVGQKGIDNATSISGVDTKVGTPANLGTGATLAANFTDVNTKIGTPVALDGGTASLSGMLTKLADDNGGASYNAETDSQEKLANTLGTPTNFDGDGATLAGNAHAIYDKVDALPTVVPLTAQQTVDALDLAPTGSAPASTSPNARLRDTHAVVNGNSEVVSATEDAEVIDYNDESDTAVTEHTYNADRDRAVTTP